MFKVGDKVKLVDDDLKGQVIRIHKNRITILDEFGFEQSFNSNELIQDEAIEINTVVITKEEKTKKPAKKKVENQVKEINIHFEALVDFTKDFTPFEMLQIQLQKVKDEMALAKVQKTKKLIFIHGHGSGKLKKEMMKVLGRYEKIKIYDASFQKYNGGATVVEF